MVGLIAVGMTCEYKPKLNIVVKSALQISRENVTALLWS